MYPMAHVQSCGARLTLQTFPDQENGSGLGLIREIPSGNNSSQILDQTE